MVYVFFISRSIGDNRIIAGPLQIVRVPIGSCGLAYSEGIVQILLPGAQSTYPSLRISFGVRPPPHFPRINVHPVAYFIE